MTCANLSHDYKEAVSYNLRRNKAECPLKLNILIFDYFCFCFEFQVFEISMPWYPWKAQGSRHVAKVVHLKEQLDIGLRNAEKFMERRCLMITADAKAQPLGALLRRVMADATPKFNEADMTRMHHIGYIDLSKFGRMTAVAIEECARWSKRVLELNENNSRLG